MDTALSDPLVGRYIGGRYHVLRLLAGGGTASVYRATDTNLNRAVAIKVLHSMHASDPDYIARFNREAESAAGLGHPNIVGIYDRGRDGELPYLVMEYIPGQTLQAMLRERGRFPAGEAAAVMDGVLAALGHAHSRGVVHRDVKPGNVLITPDSRVKVVDFGLARAAAASTLTNDSLIGTVPYLAPEQISPGRADARTDVYSAGVMFFELLTGTRPFDGETTESITHQILNDDVPAPSSRGVSVPPAIDDLVRRATARQPDARPADASALHSELAGLRKSLGLDAGVPAGRDDEPLDRTDTIVVVQPAAPGPVDATKTIAVVPPPEGPPAATAKRRRRRWPWVLAILLLAAIAAGVTGWWLAVGRYTQTPSVVGLTKTAAIAKLDKAGLKPHWLPSIYSDSIDKDLVAKESPNPGSDVRRGGAVDLRLSLGKDHVPDVRGKSIEGARALLAKFQLTGKATTRRYSDTVDRGLVITTTPKPGAVVSAGSDVTLVISDGPAPVTVADVTGKPVGDATAILQGLGLKVTTTSQFSDKVKEGDVISSNPPGGASAHKGDTVTLVVSKGPELFPVPDVRGMKLDDAKSLLESQGFTVQVSDFPGGPNRVVTQSPGPGSMKKRGSTVHLYSF